MEMEGIDATKDKDGDVLGHLAGLGTSVAGSFSVFRDRVRWVTLFFCRPQIYTHIQGRIFFNCCQDCWQRLRISVREIVLVFTIEQMAVLETDPKVNTAQTVLRSLCKDDFDKGTCC